MFPRFGDACWDGLTGILKALNSAEGLLWFSEVREAGNTHLTQRIS